MYSTHPGFSRAVCKMSKRKGKFIMKKIALFCLCAVTALSLLTGCSDGTKGGKENLGTVELGEYKGVQVAVPPAAVTDDEVNSTIQQTLSQNPSEVAVDRPAQNGDVVNIDYTGRQDGVEFAGGSAEGVDLTLGSGQMIPGFEDGLVGAKKGDKKELNLTFPTEYNSKDLAGKPAEFTVTVNAVKEKKDAVLDDAFVQKVSHSKTVDEYKASVKADLLKQRQESVDIQIQQAVLKQVVDNSTFKLNKNSLSRRYNEKYKQLGEQAKMYGSSIANLARSKGTDVPGLQREVYESSEEDMRSQLVLNAVAERESLVLNDEDRTEFAASNGQSVEDAVKSLGQGVFDQIAMNYKVMVFLGSAAVNKADPASGNAGTATGSTVKEAGEETAAAETKAGETTAAAETKAAETTAAEGTKAATATAAQ